MPLRADWHLERLLNQATGYEAAHQEDADACANPLHVGKQLASPRGVGANLEGDPEAIQKFSRPDNLCSRRSVRRLMLRR